MDLLEVGVQRLSKLSDFNRNLVDKCKHAARGQNRLPNFAEIKFFKYNIIDPLSIPIIKQPVGPLKLS